MRVGRGTEKGEGQRRTETKRNQRERGDITVDGFGYSLNPSSCASCCAFPHGAYRIREYLNLFGIVFPIGCLVQGVG